jgi:hypothetical protein
MAFPWGEGVPKGHVRGVDRKMRANQHQFLQLFFKRKWIINVDMFRYCGVINATFQNNETLFGERTVTVIVQVSVITGEVAASGGTMPKEAALLLSGNRSTVVESMPIS